MEPEKYFYEDFAKHFDLFAKSLEERGSVSRYRLHQRNFPGEPFNSPLSGLLSDRVVHFSIADLRTRVGDLELPDHFSMLPRQSCPYFLMSLFYVVLFDQVMYTHCNDKYWLFQRLTFYPKVDITIGYALPLVMDNPYSILALSEESPCWQYRDVLEKEFPVWARFMVNDMRKFLVEKEDVLCSWKQIRNSMLNDSDCYVGQYGAVFRNCLKDSV